MNQVIDYKAVNVTSVVKALNYLGAETLVTQSPNDVRGGRLSPGFQPRLRTHAR